MMCKSLCWFLALTAWASESPPPDAIAAAQRQEWPAVVTACAANFSRETSGVGFWTLYTRAAIEINDVRLAATLLDGGLVRFPANTDLRRLELALLSRSRQPAPLAQAASTWLRANPEDIEAWSARAWSAGELADTAGVCAALEALVLLRPDDHVSRRQLAEHQREHGLILPALSHFRTLMSAPSVAQDLVLAAASCAGEAGEPKLGRDWLAALPPGSQQLRLSARLAVQIGDLQSAAQALDTLIANGENDARVLNWAGHLAVQRGELARAEACFSAAGNDRTAQLHLADLYRRTDRVAQARQLLERHLMTHPGDAAARAMLATLGVGDR